MKIYSYLKTALLVFAMITLSSKISFGQWSTSGNSVSAGNFLGSTNSQPLVFKTNNSQAMVILANGNVGIGTTDPHYTLQVVGNITDSGTFFANNIECANRISVGQFQMVAGVVDSIVSTSGTIATTAAIKAGSFQSNYVQTDSIKLSDIIPHDSILYIGDPYPFINFKANLSSMGPFYCTCPTTFYSNFNSGFAFVNSLTSNCPVYLEVGSSGVPDAELNVTGPCTGSLLFSATSTTLGGDVFTINQNGQVVIGKGVDMPTGYGLYVGNGILTSLVKVATLNSSNWSDYVFKDNYKLKSLPEVAQYVKKNGHLPDVPSADDVQKNGIDLAEMDATLLKKIEELTLYVMQIQKQSEQQQQLSEQQQKQIQDLKAQLERLQNGQTK